MTLLTRWALSRQLARICSWRWRADTHYQRVQRERDLDAWLGRANAQHAQDLADEFWQQITKELRERGE